MANNNPTVYNVLLYGAKPGNSASDGVTNGTTTFTSATAKFTAADAGKLIQIDGAGSASGTLKTSIASVTNGTTIILTAGATGSHTGVIFTYGIDSTAGIQAALNACDLNNGGTVWVPNGIYILAGALVTSDNNGHNPNSQLYFPSRDVFGTTLANIITLQGESGQVNFAGGYGSTSTPLLTTGVIFKSTISGSGTNPAVLGTIGTGGQTFNFGNIAINNISIEVFSNSGTAAPTMTAFNMQNASTISMQNASALLDVINQSSVTPASSEVAGFLISNLSNGGPNPIRNCFANGFKYGFIGAEHSTYYNCYVTACVYPVVCPDTNYLIEGRFSIQGCIHGIYFPTSTTMGYHCSTGSYVDLIVEFEFDSSGFWYDSADNLTDSGNLGYGIIRFRTGANHPLGITGGSNLNLFNITGNIALSPTTLAAPLTMSDGVGSLQDLASFRNTSTGSNTGGAISLYNNVGNTPTTNGIHMFLLSSGFTGLGSAGFIANYENGPMIFCTGSNSNYFMWASAAGAISMGTGATPVASAQLQIGSTTKGLLIPVMTTTQRNAISSPADGLMVYDSTLHTPYWYLNGTWTTLASGGTPGGANTNVQYNNSGALGGDAGLTYTTGTGVFGLTKAQAAATGIIITNTNTSASAAAYLEVAGAVNLLQVLQYNALTAYAAFVHNSNGIYSTSNNLVLMVDNASGELDIAVGAAATKQFVFKATGALQLMNYGVGTFTGTATKALNVDASGNIIEGTVGGGGLTIGGSNTQVQFNNSGALGGSASLTWDGTALGALHFKGLGSQPTTTGLGTNVTSATVTTGGTDMDCTVTVVTSGAVSGTVFTLTYATSWGTTPVPIISSVGNNVSQATFPLNCGGASATLSTITGTIAGAGTYVYNIHTFH